jgi:hypothetical protein
MTRSHQLLRPRPPGAETTGFEPATFGLTGQYANRYTTPPYNSCSSFILDESASRRKLMMEEYHFLFTLSNIEACFRFNNCQLATSQQINSVVFTGSLGYWYTCTNPDHPIGAC